VGAISNFDAPASRGLTIVGNTWDKIQDLTPGASAFIDNGKANVLKSGDYIANAAGIPLITSSSGMLNTPRRRDAMIEIDMIFEPRLVVGQAVEVKSLEKVNNGTYQVIGIHHHGSISGAVDGGCITTLSLWVGATRLNPVSQ